MAFGKSLFALLVAVMVAFASANEFHHPDVADLKGSEFTEKVGDGGVWFVKFYAPWCGHCKRLAGDWGKLGEAFKDNSKVNVAHVDCTVDKDTCSKFEIRGYPTLKVIVNGSEFKAYKGARDLDTLKSWLSDTAKEALGETTA
eukprot:jgi/Ulvmu1/454/UM001_0461.1